MVGDLVLNSVEHFEGYAVLGFVECVCCGVDLLVLV